MRCDDLENRRCSSCSTMAFFPSVRLLGTYGRKWGGVGTRTVSSVGWGSIGTHAKRRDFSGLAAAKASKLNMSNVTESDGGVTTSDLKNAPKFRLAPSDFAFLWKECKRCFYLKSHGHLYRPRSPFPSVFNKIDLAMKNFFMGKRTESLLPNMPPGEFLCEEDDAWVESEPLNLGRKSLVFIRGKIDCLCLNDDQTYSIIDFKTSDISRHLSIYSRQLHAYAFALEHPSNQSEIEQGVVTDMGLVVYEPNTFGFSKVGNKEGKGAAANLSGNCVYHPIKKDTGSFINFLGEVVDVLEGEIPDPTPSCPCCSYLANAKSRGYIKT